jgi:dTDP-4-amino-4,6-dideoxygalactose transaminase
MGRINSVAEENGIVVIEDAAQAHGSVLGNRKAGALGHVSCFSFYPTKNLGGYGDGGMVLTDDAKVAAHLRVLRNYGKKHNPFDSEILGYNSRLDELQASILRVKLRYLDLMNNQRKTLVDMYRDGLDGLPVRFLREYDGVKMNHHVCVVRTRP